MEALLADCAGLAVELQADLQMRQLHAQHIREMTLMKYQARGGGRAGYKRVRWSGLGKHWL